VRIRSYGSGWTKGRMLNHMTKLLQVRTAEVSDGVYWGELVYADIITTIRFADKTEGALEESGGHVCFTDHSKSARWLRILLSR
jgi:hypothetical protein